MENSIRLIIIAYERINGRRKIQWIYSYWYDSILNYTLKLIDYSDKLEITHRHARGPGGQHVNKSKNVSSLDQLPFD